MDPTTQRNTRQREAIRYALESAARPLAPLELLALSQTTVHGLGIATVYRNIKAMLDEGWLTAVALPGGQTVYELAGKEHHHHFQCESCRKVFELEGCLPAIHSLAPPGFYVRRHEITLCGLCPDCREQQ